MSRWLGVALVLVAGSAQAAVIVQKSQVGTAVQGGRITYRIQINRITETNLVLRDPIPANHDLLTVQTAFGMIDCTQVASGPIGGGLVATCHGTGGALEVTIPDNPPAIPAVSATYRVRQATSTNAATVLCSAAQTQCGSGMATGVVGVAPLTITKTASVGSLQPGQSFDYGITVTQNGPTDVVGITVADPLPDGVTCDKVDAPVATTIGLGKTITLAPTVPLDPGTPYAFTLHCKLDPSAPGGTLRNIASATAPGGTAIPSAPVDLSVAGTPATLTFAKVAVQKKAAIGDTVDFTLSLTPSGPQPGPIRISDAIDPAVDVVGISIDGQKAVCSAMPQTVAGWTVSCGATGHDLSLELPAGQTLTQTMTARLSVKLLPVVGARLTNAATVSDAGGKMLTSSDGIDIAGVNPGAGASVLVTSGKVLAEKGDLVPFTVTIGVPRAAAPLAAPILFLKTTAGLRTGDVRINGALSRPSELNGALQVPLPAIPAGSTLTVEVRSRLNGRATPGAQESLAAQLGDGRALLGGAEAHVRVIESPEFDLATILGEVYRDDNGNGQRDRGEPGISGALIVMDDGLQSITDAMGHYHLAAVRPGDRVIKLASHTLPPGSVITTDEARVWPITPGILTKIDFGVHVPAPTAPTPRPLDPNAPLPEIRREGGGLRYQLAGQVVSGARVLVCPRTVDLWACKAATVDAKTGSWTAELHLLAGRNRLAVVTSWPDGRLTVGERDVYWVARPAGGDLVVPRPEENRLVLRFPPGAVADPNVVVEGLVAPGTPLEELQVAGQPLVPDANGKVAIKLRLGGAGAGISVLARFSDGLAVRFDHLQQANGNFVVLVGLAEGKIGYVLRDGAAGQSGLYAQGRVKLYVKGRIQGRWLLEGGIDIDSAALSSWRDLFRGDPTRVFRNLDPDRFYTVYGDSSQTTANAQTRGRLFVRLEFDQSELVFGNFQTGLTGTEMGRYSRAVTGGRINFVRASTDPPRPDGTPAPPSTQIIIFGAWLQTARAHDEMRGTGGSLFYLSHRTIVEGSEQVRVELRDVVSDRPITNVPQRATADYEIDYLAGRVLMRQPISSFGASPTLIRSNLNDGDRPYLIVDYEYVVDGDIDEATVGGRATQRIGRVRIGGTAVNEFRSGTNYTLLGADLQIDLKKYGVIIAEYAHSYGTMTTMARSDDGGLRYYTPDASTQRVDSRREGDAWKVEADLKFGCTEKSKGCLHLKPYTRGVTQGFNDTAHAGDAGYYQWGAEVEASVWKLKLLAHYDERRYFQASYDAIGGGTQTASQIRRDAGGDIAGTFGKVTIRVGARTERADDSDATRAGARTAVGARIDIRLIPRLTLYGTGQYSLEHVGQGLLAQDNSLGALGIIATMPWELKMTAEASGGPMGFGGLLSLQRDAGPGRIIYGTVTLSQDRDDRLSTTVTAGGRERVADKAGNARAVLFAEDQFRDGPFGGIAGGRSQVLVSGVDLPLAKRFVIGATFERGSVTPSGTPLANQPPLQRTAGTAYASYGGEKIRVQLRAEVRNDETPAPIGAFNLLTPTTHTLQWVANGMVTWTPHKDLTLRGKVFFSRTSGDTDATLARSTEVTAGFAWRPSFTDRIALLGRYTYLDEFAPDAQAVNGPVNPLTSQPLGLREQAHVVSLAGEGRLFWRFSLGEKIAAKWRHEPVLGTSDWFILWVNRLSLHITQRWAAVVEYRLLSVPGVSITHGVSVEGNLILVKHLRLGAGWNFADFSDNELTLGRGRENGFFLRAQGFY